MFWLDAWWCVECSYVMIKVKSLSMHFGALKFHLIAGCTHICFPVVLIADMTVS